MNVPQYEMLCNKLSNVRHTKDCVAF